MTEAAQKPKVIDNPDVTEVYANKFISAAFDGGAVSLTFGCIRFVPERTDSPPRQGQQPEVHVTGRLALSPTAAVELINSLNNILATISQKSGSPVTVANPPPAPAKPAH
jgi:hypothetical protein